MALELRSTAFKQGERIPTAYTCDGGNHSPPFSWSEPPRGTKSLLLICVDPDAPGGSFHHWAIWNIPVTRQGLNANCSASAAQLRLKQAINDFGRSGYGGPCPPKKDKPHRYCFRLYALNVDALPVSEQSTVQDVLRAAQRHGLATAELIGTYGRSPS